MRKRKNQRTTILAAATIAAVLTWGGALAVAAAATISGAPHIAIGAFHGPESTRVREAVEDQLADRYVLLPEALVADSARQSGMRLETERAFAEVGRDLNIAAFVSATVRHHGTWRVEITVRQGDTGRLVVEFDWSDSSIDKLTARLGPTLAKRLEGLLGPRTSQTDDARAERGVADVDRVGPPLADRRMARAAPSSRILVTRTEDDPPPLADKRAPRAAPSSRTLAIRSDDDDDRDPPRLIGKRMTRAGASSRTLATRSERKDASANDVAVERATRPDTSPAKRFSLEVRVDGRVFNRTFAYADNFSRLPGYSAGAFALDAEVAVHPFAMIEGTRDSPLASVGITGAASYSPGVQSSASSTGDSPRTEVRGYELGARLRTTLGAVELFPRVAYLVDGFAARLGELSSDVTYRAGRVGSLARYALSARFTAFGSIDYLHVVSVGTTAQDRFPRATIRGVDASLGTGYRVADSVEVELAAKFRRYAFAMNVLPTDPVIVGGASDQYFSVTFGLAYRPSSRGH